MASKFSDVSSTVAILGLLSSASITLIPVGAYNQETAASIPGYRQLHEAGGTEEGTTNASQGEDSAGAAGSPDGTEPDARFTFANERTFLAWSRTALALVAAGLAIVQLLPPFPGIPWARHIIGTPLILLGSAVAMISYFEWTGNQRALRRGEPVARSRLPLLLAVTVAAIGLAAAALALVSAVSTRR